MTDTSVENCWSCSAFRAVRKYRGLWLCTNGPTKCYRHRKAICAGKRRGHDMQFRPKLPRLRHDNVLYRRKPVTA